MNKISAHYVYHKETLFSQVVIEVDSFGKIQIEPLENEIANTEFYNGLIFILETNEEIQSIINLIEQRLQEHMDILQVFPELEKENRDKVSDLATYFILFEDIDLQQKRWLLDSKIHCLHASS